MVDKKELNDVADLDIERAKFSPVMGKDKLVIVLFYAFWKLVLKTFSLSAVFAVVASTHLDDAIAKGAEGWYHWAFAGIAWLNFVARPQFKEAVSALSAHWRAGAEAKRSR